MEKEKRKLKKNWEMISKIWGISYVLIAISSLSGFFVFLALLSELFIQIERVQQCQCELKEYILV